jgi:hypothetical protein
MHYSTFCLLKRCATLLVSMPIEHYAQPSNLMLSVRQIDEFHLLGLLCYRSPNSRTVEAVYVLLGVWFAKP